MSILQPAPVSSNRFHYMPAENLLVAEASDLPNRGEFGRVWDDACDQGITVVSHPTGHAVVYSISHTEWDREGDLLYWDLVPADRRLQGTVPTVRIFND